MGLNTLNAWSQGPQVGGWGRQLGEGGNTMILQKRWDGPYCLLCWASTKEGSWNGEVGWKEGL